VIRTDIGDEQMLELALVENLQRQDLDPLERARGLRELMKLLGLTQEQVADKVGLKRPSVTNLLRLLELPAQVQDAVARGRLSMGHARAILGVEGDAARIRLAAGAEADGLSVRDVEARVRSEQRGGSKTAPRGAVGADDSVRPTWCAELEQRMREALSTRVTVRDAGNYRGQIVIEYFSRADLDRIVVAIAPQVPI
jgi:ParB family chromosome partitioning protein